MWMLEGKALPNGLNEPSFGVVNEVLELSMAFWPPHGENLLKEKQNHKMERDSR